MKTLMLIRHAKSDWGTIGARDYDRTLNSRGLRDATTMGKRFKKEGQIPDSFISSTAKRAEKSCQLMSQAMAYPVEKVEWFDNLYLASPSTILDIISKTPAHVSTLAVLAHNPGVTELAELLSGQAIGNMPTAAVVTLTAHVNDWQAENTIWEVQDFDYPKL